MKIANPKTVSFSIRNPPSLHLPGVFLHRHPAKYGTHIQVFATCSTTACVVAVHLFMISVSCGQQRQANGCFVADVAKRFDWHSIVLLIVSVHKHRVKFSGLFAKLSYMPYCHLWEVGFPAAGVCRKGASMCLSNQIHDIPFC